MLGSITKPHIFAIFIHPSEFSTRYGTWTAGPLEPTIVTFVMMFSCYQFILPGAQGLLRLSWSTLKWPFPLNCLLRFLPTSLSANFRAPGVGQDEDEAVSPGTFWLLLLGHSIRSKCDSHDEVIAGLAAVGWIWNRWANTGQRQ
jgi:hypothetical protein